MLPTFSRRRFFPSRFTLAMALALLTLAAFSVAERSLANQPAAGPIVHIVMVWMKPEAGERARDQAMAAASQLEKIPGVSRVRAGLPVMSERATVDDSFSFGITMELTGPEMMSDYLKHPIHVEYVNTYIKGKARKTLIYDF